MKTNLLFFLVLISGFFNAQLSQNFYNENGLSLSYRLDQVESDKSGLDKYKAILVVNNSNNFKIKKNVGPSYVSFKSINPVSNKENYFGTSFQINNEQRYTIKSESGFDNVGKALALENQNVEINMFPTDFYVFAGEKPQLIEWKMSPWKEITDDGRKRSENSGLNSNSNSMNQNTIYESVDQFAEFPGGIKAFQKLLMEVFPYENVNENFKTGDITQISFTVNNDGTFQNIKASGAHPDVNQSYAVAAIRLKKKGVKFKPAVNNGRAVTSTVTIPIKISVQSQ